ncbi:MAG: diguanylate cyclase [Anaerotruncus sp.]|nr:diguanylate cyclase [Anaerotruncus sp.]
MNRAILADMLEMEYEIIEAGDGVEAVAAIQQYSTELSLILLDIVMPEMDGFGVLSVMNKRHWIEEIPVIVISAETASSQMERAFELGVTDFISRPFDSLIVRRRVINTILLYAKQKRLVGMVADQIYEKEQRSSVMIDILSQIVEFRNGESGQHVRHVHVLSDLMLRELVQLTDQYALTRSDISLISTASALHDIGKIAIDEAILNKPGRLTPKEFEIMKRHAMIGANMLRELPIHQNEPLLKIAYQICRWHHERYDGKGYPDGLVGDDIPISAQIVALADVYDALTSERCYKKAISHEQAVEMIVNGECGTFNPLLLTCLKNVADTLLVELENDTPDKANRRELMNIADEMGRHEELTASERTLHLLEHERMKYRFFAAMTREIQFEYVKSPAMVTITAWGAEKLGLGEVIMDPLHNEKVLQLMSETDWKNLSHAILRTTPEQAMVNYVCKLNYNGEEQRWTRIIVQSIWSADEPPEYTGVIGKAVDIHDSRVKEDNLERMANHDALTGLLNHASIKKQIIERLESAHDGHFALVMFDLDHFKSVNDNYGHDVGNKVLVHTSEKLRQGTRGDDLAARIGGDEFLIFLEYKTDIEPVIQRIFTFLTGHYENISISVSMGVACTEVVGIDYDTLFRSADQALYAVKRGGRGHHRFYDSSMQNLLSTISPIDGENEAKKQEGDE